MDLVSESAKAAASAVAEAQCESGRITEALDGGPAKMISSLLRSEHHILAPVYFRVFLVTLHRLEFTTALEHISVEAIFTFLSLRIDSNAAIPQDRWELFLRTSLGRTVLKEPYAPSEAKEAAFLPRSA